MRFPSVTSGRGTISAIHCATTMPAAGMAETARSTLTILGKTAPRPCSAGATSMMESVMASVTALGVSTMALTVKDRKDSASKSKNKVKNILLFFKEDQSGNLILISFLLAHFMTSTVKTTTLMGTVTRAAIMQNVNGMAWTVLTTCQRSLQMGTSS